MNSRIEGSQFSVFFPRQINIRKHFFNIESIFSNKFSSPFQLLPIPDDAPAEIPRIEAHSQNGHSKLNISQSHILFQTHYDSGWEIDWGRISQYLSENMGLIYKALESLGLVSLNFAGLVVEMYYPLGNNEQAIRKLKDIYLKSDLAASEFIDLNLRFTQVKEGKYYINYHVSNSRKFEGAAQIPRLVPAYLKEHGHGVSLKLDINDRYAYNYQREYISDSQEGLQLLNLVGTVFSKGIDNLLESGGFGRDV